MNQEQLLPAEDEAPRVVEVKSFKRGGNEWRNVPPDGVKPGMRCLVYWTKPVQSVGLVHWTVHHAQILEMSGGDAWNCWWLNSILPEPPDEILEKVKV